MLARVGLPLLRSNSNPSLEGDSPSSSSATSRSTITPGGPSPFPGERLLLPTPPPGTSDPMAFLVDDSLSDLQKQKKYCLSSLPLQRLIFLRRLSSVARVFGVSATVEHLLPLLPRLAADKEDVIRQAVGIEVAALVVYLANPLRPQPQPVRPKLEDEEPWPEMWQAAAEEPVPLAPPVYVHPKSGKPTPLDRTIATPVSPSVKSPVSSSSATPVSSSPASPTGPTADAGAKAGGDKGNTSKGFFAKGKSLLTSARENLSASSSPSTSPPLTPTGTSSASSSASVSSSSSSASSSTAASSASSSSSASTPSESSSSAFTSSSASSSASTSSSVSSISSSSSTSFSSTSYDSPAEQPDSSSRTDSPLQPDTSSTQIEPSLSVNTSSISSTSSSANASTVSSPSGSAASSPHAKPSSANRAPLTFDDPVHEIGYSHISTTLIPVVQQLLLDANSEVRTAACDALVTAADVVREQDIGTVVLTSVLNLAHDERDEQRTTAVLLMHELAPKFGYDLCKSFVALELAAFADDASIKVRKSTAQCFGNVCAVVGESFTVSKLLPCYVRLSKDLIWGVRKGCVESLVCRCVPLDVKREVFIPMFERFAKDNSRWVRNGAFEVLGPLLHVLGQELITRELLHHFTNIPNMSSSVIDAEVTYHVAFNFPAVLLALGPYHWEELLPLFTSLSKDSKPGVRRSIACSLHEVGHILGPAGTLQHVVPVIDAYLRDVDEVKGGVVKTFASLLRCMPAEKREEYVETLWSVQKQRQHWRWRYQWARQLPAFALLFSSDTTASSLIPLTFSLCRDSVAIVRLTASRAVGSLVKRLMSDNSGGLSAAISACKAFANGNTYMERQLFVHMCEGLIVLIPASLFIEEFLPVICALTADPIKNVRIALAAFFSVLSSRYVEYGSEREDVRAMIDKLRQDVDRDVRQAMMKEEEKKREAEKERALMEEMEKSRNESSIADSKRMDDDSDRELDEILGHSANDREEEAAERAKSMPRRLSASQEEEIVKIAEMQHHLAKEGVREDKAENEILQPSEEKEMQRLPVDPIVLTTTKKAADNHMDIDSLKTAGDGGEGTTGHLPHITLPVLTQSHARVSGHPAHVATPRASVSPHSFAQLLPADDSSGQGGGNAPMEVEEATDDSQTSDAAAAPESDASESMLTEDDQPTATLGSAADDTDAVQADNNGTHTAPNGSSDVSNGGSKSVVDSALAHQNGVEKRKQELQS